MTEGPSVASLTPLGTETVRCQRPSFEHLQICITDMPELPEVETMVRGIRPFVEGRRIEAVKRCGCRFRPISIQPRFELLAKRLSGRRIETVCRLGKRVVLHVSGGSALVIEPRMTGLMLLSDPPDRAHLRIEWRLAGKPAEVQLALVLGSTRPGDRPSLCSRRDGPAFPGRRGRSGRTRNDG